MASINDVCKDIIGSVDGSLGCGVIDLGSGLLLGVAHNVPYFTQSYLDAVAGAAVDMLRVSTRQPYVISLAVNLTVADTSVTSQADTFVITQINNLKPNDAFVTSQVDYLLIDSSKTLILNDTYVASQVDSPLLVISKTLAVNDSFVTSQTDAVVTDEIISWFYPDTLTINTGSIESGILRDTWSDNGTELVLNETTGTPGFSYTFRFGNEQDVPYII